MSHPTMSEVFDSAVADYFASDGYSMRRPTVEEGHTKACLAYAMQCAIENYRDGDYVTDSEFASMALRGAFAGIAFDYLNESCLVDCRCPKRYDEDKHTFRIRARRAVDGTWATDFQFMTLTEAALMVTDDIDCGYYDMAWIGLAAPFADNVTPCLWASLSYRTQIA